MNKTTRKVKYLIFVICGLIFIALNFGLGAMIQISLTENLQKFTGYTFGILTNTIDYLTLATIPFFGMVYNSTRSEFKKSELIMDILNILFWTILMFGIGLYIMTFIGKPVNHLLPQYLLSEPFNLYSTILIGIGITTPFLILKLIKK